MTLPIYRQVRAEVPAEWLHDDEEDGELQPPSQWDTYVGYFWAAVLVAMIVGLEYMALMGVQP